MSDQLYKIILRHDTSTNWTINDTVLSLGEYGVEDDTHRVKRGDGETPWSELTYETFGLEFIVTFENLSGDVTDCDALTEALDEKVSADLFSTNSTLVSEINITNFEGKLARITKVDTNVIKNTKTTSYLDIQSSDNSITGIWTINDTGLNILDLQSKSAIGEYTSGTTYIPNQICFYEGMLLKAKDTIIAEEEIDLSEWDIIGTTVASGVSFEPGEDSGLESTNVQDAIIEVSKAVKEDNWDTLLSDIKITTDNEVPTLAFSKYYNEGDKTSSISAHFDSNGLIKTSLEDDNIIIDSSQIDAKIETLEEKVIDASLFDNQLIYNVSSTGAIIDEETVLGVGYKTYNFESKEKGNIGVYFKGLNGITTSVKSLDEGLIFYVDGSELNDSINELIENVSSLDVKDTELQNLIDTNTNNIEELQANILNVQNDISELQTNVTDIQTSLSEVQNNITSLTEQVDTNTNNINTNTNNITSLTNDLNTLKTNVIAINTVVTEHDTEIETLQSQVTTIKSDISTNTSDILELQTSVETNADNIVSLQTELQTSINTVNETIDDVKSTITQFKEYEQGIQYEIGQIVYYTREDNITLMGLVLTTDPTDSTQTAKEDSFKLDIENKVISIIGIPTDWVSII